MGLFLWPVVVVVFKDEALRKVGPRKVCQMFSSVLRDVDLMRVFMMAFDLQCQTITKEYPTQQNHPPHDRATTGQFCVEHIFSFTIQHYHHQHLPCSTLIRSHFGSRLLCFACPMPFNILAFHAPQREHIVAGAGRVTQRETVGHKHIVAYTQPNTTRRN